jgi:predicted DNA-binding protein with PD1-like motif
MQYSQASPGRIFILRLEDGEILHEELERFAREHEISAAAVVAVGGVDQGSILVVGPRESRAAKIEPMLRQLADTREVTGTGTLFPDDEGNPVLHMHIACGREGDTVTGCVRKGVKIWHVLEVVIFELVGAQAARRVEESTGFALLQCGAR